MTELQRCMTCKWWRRIKGDELHLIDANGHCHRYPPKLNELQVKAEMEYGERTDDVDAPGDYATSFNSWVFPVVESISFCGEWSHATERVIDEKVIEHLAEIERETT
jgi:hypothetical protein